MKKPTTYHLPPTTYSSRSGFTLLELLVFTGIFVVISVAFVLILVSMAKIQVRQSAASEVNGQSGALLQAVERYVGQSSLVEMPPNAETSTLRLRMPSASADPTIIYLDVPTGVVFVQESSSAAQPLTSSRVTVSNLSFVKRSNPPGHDSVSVSFVVSYNTPNIAQKFVQSLASSISRVSAATFDSDIRASSTNTYKIGAAAGEWQSINNTIYFSGANVGIGTASPGALLHVSGGDIKITSGDIYTDTAANGLILKSPGGTCFRVTITNAGLFSTSSVTCP